MNNKRSWNSICIFLVLTAVMMTAVAGTADARYYDPALARFLSADTEEGPNRYAYVNNNPVNMVDPTGNEAVYWDERYGWVDGSPQMPWSKNVEGLRKTFVEGMFIAPIGGINAKSAMPVIWEKAPWLRAKLDHLDEVEKVWTEWSGTKSTEAGQQLLDVVGKEFRLDYVKELKFGGGKTAGVMYSEGNSNYITIGRNGMTSVTKIRETIAEQLQRVEDKVNGIAYISPKFQVIGQNAPRAILTKLRAAEAGMDRILAEAMYNSAARKTLMEAHEAYKHYLRININAIIEKTLPHEYLPFLSRFGNGERMHEIKETLYNIHRYRKGGK